MARGRECTSESTVMIGTRPPLRLTSCTAYKAKHIEKAEVQVGRLSAFIGPEGLSSTTFVKITVGIASIRRGSQGQGGGTTALCLCLAISVNGPK